MRILIELEHPHPEFIVETLRMLDPRAKVTEHGWWCKNTPACGVFNGSLKEDLKHCRSCGEPRNKE